ncbi:MAG: hypothetical protein JWN24_653 [Phycisphaerales bacterium]|nr:hypothetical protein [Phycisphaerales bacterium]
MLCRLFKFLPILSLLLCAALCVLWVRSYRVRDRAGLCIRDARYTIHCDHGRLMLTGPPNPGPADALARQMAARISNDEVQWEPVFRWKQADGTYSYLLQSHIKRASDTWAMYCEFDFKGGMQSTGMRSAARPLLMALEDPNRAIAAHHELLFLRQGSFSETPEAHGDQVTIYHDGLPVVYRIADFHSEPFERKPDYYLTSPIPLGQADPSAWKALRDMWHDRLDVQMASVRFGWPVAVAAMLPLFSLRRLWMRRKATNRRRRGLCPSCGYDLRATPGRCPECGKEAPSTATA